MDMERKLATERKGLEVVAALQVVLVACVIY
jgi:hypothetical protein